MSDQYHPEPNRPPPLMSVRLPIGADGFLATTADTNANGSANGNLGPAIAIDSSESLEPAEKSNEVVLPKALENILALQDRRAAELNTIDDATVHAYQISSADIGDDADDSDEDYETQVNGEQIGKPGKQSKADKNKKKKLRKKQNKKLRQQARQQVSTGFVNNLNSGTVEPSEDKKSATPAESEASDEVHNDATVDEPATATVVESNERVTRSSSRRKKKSADSEKTPEKPKTKKGKNEQNKQKTGAVEEEVEIEYVPEKITIAELAPMHRQFYRVFEAFKLETKTKLTEKDKHAASAAESLSKEKKPADKQQHDDDDDDDFVEEEPKEDKEKLSKRKLKKLTRLSVAELKQLVSRPDVVEMHDVTARDPKLLVQLKAYRNTVQVPRHWCFKRKYLQGKRGIEKPPFDLPAFIKKTGIMEMRESLHERDEAKTMKAKMRERVRPKMGNMDIDYQKLHDAFFKWQTKPRMTIHGDLYYEGKEFETRLKEKKPGDLSEELRIALGMPVGPNAHKIPPPWLIAQQRYGPPPSYPNLKIPGLNAPIPEGCSFGYHAGGWGKPPVDELGKPLYGDVFGTNLLDADNGVDEGDIERNQWGEMESESEESSAEEDEEGEDLGNQIDEGGLVTPAEGLVTPSGLTSVPTGLETPDNIELRKKKIESEMEDNETPVLYQVLPQKNTDRIVGNMMGSTHVYDITNVNKAPPLPPTAPPTRQTTDREGIVELALDPSELDLDNDAMAQRYEETMREQQNHLLQEDVTDLVAEHVARKSKRKRQQADTTKPAKKYKEFKF